jgi:hypothetical protein
MPEDIRNVKIRVRSGESEAEIEASFSDVNEAIELIPKVLAKLPQSGPERRQAPLVSEMEIAAPAHREPSTVALASFSSASSVPIVTIEKGDSLSEVISKFFADSWGRSPKKLMEVREALQSYGLNYPKQSVAVALLRLAKGSKIRRFKGEAGEYVYTVTTGAARIPAPLQPAAEAVPAIVESVEQEEQLDLDAPTAH